jgi:hypothetical protein
MILDLKELEGTAMIKRVVVLLLTIGLVFPFPIFSAVIGEFAVVTGDVTVQRAGKVIKPQVKDKVETLDLVQTGKNSNARVVLSDDSAMALGPNSRLEMKQFTVQDGKTTGLFSVLAGLIQTNVVKALGPGSKFEIQTPTAIAGVRGTAWLTLVELAFQSAAKSSFYALEQSVFVLNPAFPTQIATVAAGNFSVVVAGAAPTAAGTFSASVVSGLTATLGSAAIAGLAGVAGAGVAGAAAGTAATAGLTAGTVALGAAVAAAAIVAVVNASSGSSTTTTHHH